MLSFCQKVFLWHQTLCANVQCCVCKVSDGFSKSSGTSWFPCTCTIWALTKPLLKSSVKMAKFKMLSFCQKVFLWHQTSSCKCSMCLHCVYKVSGCFTLSCGLSWIPHICTTYAPFRITEGNNTISICLQSLMNFHHCLFKILQKNQHMDGRRNGKMDGWTTWKQYTSPPPQT